MGCKFSSLLMCSSKKNKVSCKKTLSDVSDIELIENNYLYWDEKNIIKKTDKIIDLDDIPYEGQDKIL